MTPEAFWHESMLYVSVQYVQAILMFCVLNYPDFLIDPLVFNLKNFYFGFVWKNSSIFCLFSGKNLTSTVVAYRWRICMLFSFMWYMCMCVCLVLWHCYNLKKNVGIIRKPKNLEVEETYCPNNWVTHHQFLHRCCKQNKTNPQTYLADGNCHC